MEKSKKHEKAAMDQSIMEITWDILSRDDVLLLATELQHGTRKSIRVGTKAYTTASAFVKGWNNLHGEEEQIDPNTQFMCFRMRPRN